MGVLWASIGASGSYQRFAGIMELTGGILLFIPWLAILGAMVTFADAVQISAAGAYEPTPLVIDRITA